MLYAWMKSQLIHIHTRPALQQHRASAPIIRHSVQACAGNLRRTAICAVCQSGGEPLSGSPQRETTSSKNKDGAVSYLKKGFRIDKRRQHPLRNVQHFGNILCFDTAMHGLFFKGWTLHAHSLQNWAQGGLGAPSVPRLDHEASYDSS